MIIGNNNDFKNNNFLNTKNNFKTKFNQYKNNEKTNHKNIFVKDIKEQVYTNVNNRDDMYNKSLAMLNERLNNGLISLDEFNKQVKELLKNKK